MTWAWVPHSTFLELKLEQTFWKRMSCRSQEAACRAVSKLGPLPTRLSVSALKRVWDWLALTESNHCSRRPRTRVSSACPGCSPLPGSDKQLSPCCQGCFSRRCQTFWGHQSSAVMLLLKKAKGWVMNGAAFAASIQTPYGQLQLHKWTVARRKTAFTLSCYPSTLHSSTSKQNKKLFILYISVLVCGF